MASVRAAVELEDHVSGTMYSIETSMYSVMGVINKLQSSVSSFMKVTPFIEVKSGIEETKNAMRELDDTINEISVPSINMNPVISAIGQANENFNQLGSTINSISGASGNSLQEKEKSKTSNKSGGMIEGIKKMLPDPKESLEYVYRLQDGYNKALNSMQAQTGLTANEIGDSIKNIYANNVGADFQDVADSMAQVNHVTGASGSNLEGITEAGMLMRDTFGLDIKDSVSSMDMLMKQFGLSGNEAFNLIAQGAQQGLNSNGDLLDNINQYSSQFSEAGLGADEMFAVLKGGLEDGTVGMENMKGAISKFGSDFDGTKDTLEEINDINCNDLGNTLSEIGRTMSVSLLEPASNIANVLVEMINAITPGLTWITSTVIPIIGDGLLWIMELIQNIGGFVSDNWSIIQPILFGAILAIGLLKAAMFAYSIVQKISALVTKIQTAEQVKLNTSIFACPITWIILAIIALIAIFYAAIGAVNQFSGSTYSATGIICGIFATAAAVIWNTFLGLFDLVLGLVNHFYNTFAGFANFFANFLDNPISSVIYLFQGMADAVLGILENIASAMDNIFGTSMKDTVSGWRSGLKGMADEAVKKLAADEKYEDVVDKINLKSEDFGLKRMDYEDAFKEGYFVGEKVDEKVSQFDPSNLFGGDKEKELRENLDKFNEKNKPNEKDLLGKDDNLTKVTEGIEGTEENTKKMSDDVEISSEDLKYLRDYAQTKIINRFTTAEIKVEMNNKNNISSSADVGEISEALRKKIEKEMYAVAGGAR